MLKWVCSYNTLYSILGEEVCVKKQKGTFGIEDQRSGDSNPVCFCHTR